MYLLPHILETLTSQEEAQKETLLALMIPKLTGMLGDLNVIPWTVRQMIYTTVFIIHLEILFLDRLQHLCQEFRLPQVQVQCLELPPVNQGSLISMKRFQVI